MSFPLKLGMVVNLVNDYFTQARNDIYVRTFFWLLRCSDIVNKYVELELVKRGSDRTRIALTDILIRNKGAVPQKNLAKSIFRTKQGTAKVIDRLEREGLVERNSYPGDRRAKIIRITKKGVDNMLQIFPGIIPLCHNIMSCVSESEAEQLQDTLYRLSKNLSQQIESRERLAPNKDATR
jgi:DNA-binding MarR family transcriptional regulator